MNATMRWVLAALLLLGAGGVSAAGSRLHRLPADRELKTGDGSPGKVTFSHGSHVDTAKPACLACHPRLFRITEKERLQDVEPITHARMEKGGACGACHGKSAFNFETCDMCHKS